ncbi:hypothetical protein MPSEU_000621700 [Mayamaea pseudoterrestris]|nr:hypothetical protein MPSEU_000621700 [Mayamaea pseudoterrestris]
MASTTPATPSSPPAASASGKEQSPEETQAHHELNELLHKTRTHSTAPKGLGQGLSQGVSNIVSGAVGAAGVAVLAPTMGLAVGAKQAGVLGGVAGFVGGALVGIVGGAGILLGGAVSGATQIVRGVLAAPEAAMAPRQGKWWNDVEGRWVLTKMSEESATLNGVPDDDGDLLGKIQADLDDQASTKPKLDGKDGQTATVKETFYYDALDVPVNADEATIRRRYYILARQYHPDRNHDDPSAPEKFKQVSEAYQVLGDVDLRKKYDHEGRDGLSADKTAAGGNLSQIDPAVLYAFLFGSDLFHDYIGRLATATSASVGDSQRVSMSTARLLQKRRLVRLAIKLVEMVQPHVEAQAEKTSVAEIEAKWAEQAKTLSQASYGYELVQCIGQTYNLMGTMYQGSMNSGHGLPSASQWALRQKAILDKKKMQNENAMGGMRAGVDMFKLQADLVTKMQAAQTVDEREAVQKELNDAAMGIMLRMLWTTTVVDVTSTLYEVTHMVLFDQDVDKETRWRRSEAIKALGSAFMAAPAPKNNGDQDLKQMYEDAAFAAMLETVKRRDASATREE